MCELLVRVVDKINPNDKRLDALCTKRGDVIAIQDDGWQWSKAETAGDPWIVIKVPGALASDLSAFLVPEPYDPAVDTKLPQRRAFCLNMALFDALADKTLTRDQALSMKVIKPPIPANSVLNP